MLRELGDEFVLKCFILRSVLSHPEKQCFARWTLGLRCDVNMLSPVNSFHLYTSFSDHYVLPLSGTIMIVISVSGSLLRNTLESYSL